MCILLQEFVCSHREPVAVGINLPGQAWRDLLWSETKTKEWNFKREYQIMTSKVIFRFDFELHDSVQMS